MKKLLVFPIAVLIITVSLGTSTVKVAHAGVLSNFIAQQMSNVLKDLKIQKSLPLLITNVQSTNITANTATISWETNKVADSRVTYWKIPLKKKDLTQDEYVSTTTKQHTLLLENLTPETVYGYTVTSVDSYGKKQTSPKQTFTTLSVPIPLEISNVQATSTLASTTVITWDTNNVSDGAVTYWKTASSSTSTDATVYASTTSTMHEVLLNDLVASTSYSYFVTSKDLLENSTSSSVYEFTTGVILVPPQPILMPAYFGIEVKNNGDYYVTGFSGISAALGVIGSSTGNTEILASGGNLDQSVLADIIVDENGDVIANEFLNRNGGINRIITIDKNTGTQSTISEEDLFSSGAGQLGGLDMDGEGNLIVLDCKPINGPVDCEGNILRININNGLQTIFKTIQDYRFRGLAYEQSTNNIYVVGAYRNTPTDPYIERLSSINLDNGSTTVIAEGNYLTNTRDIAIDSNGDFLVLNAPITGGVIVKVDKHTAVQNIISSVSGSITNAVDIAIEPSGTILVLDLLEGIYKINPVTGEQEKLDFELEE